MVPTENTKISARSWKLLDRLWITTATTKQIIAYLDDPNYWAIHDYALRVTAGTVAAFVQDQRVKRPGERSNYIFRMMQKRRRDGLYHRRPYTNAKSVLRVARSNHYQWMLKQWREWFPKRHQRAVEFNRAKQVLQALAAKWDDTYFDPLELVNRELLGKLLISVEDAEQIMDSLLLLDQLLQFVFDNPKLGIEIISLSEVDETRPMTIAAFIPLMSIAGSLWSPRTIRKLSGVYWRKVDQDRLIKLSKLLLDVLKTNPTKP